MEHADKHITVPRFRPGTIVHRILATGAALALLAGAAQADTPAADPGKSLGPSPATRQDKGSPDAKAPSDGKLGLHSDGGGWGFTRAAKPDAKLPRVLLVGDSVMNGYRGEVIRLLAGKANVDTWATGMHLGGEHLISDLTKVLQQGPYAVIHFNIGLHDWPEGRIPPDQYEPLMQRYFETYSTNAPSSKLIWASSTPVTAKGAKTLDPKINPTIVRQNETAARVANARSVPINDLYTLGTTNLTLARGDQFHWTAPGSRLFAEQVAREIAARLPAPAK